MAPRRPISIPAGSWPPRMNADMAAGYCGEKHVEDFLSRVGETYPPPKWIETTRRRFWSRIDLDRALGITERPTGMGERFSAALREKRNG